MWLPQQQVILMDKKIKEDNILGSLGQITYKYIILKSTNVHCFYYRVLFMLNYFNQVNIDHHTFIQ